MSGKLKGIVSVIIPAYNAEIFLEKAVVSAVEQGSVVREVIIIDNNSTDGTALIMQGLKEQYAELIIITSCGTQGPAATRNHGINLAQGEWLQFLDADDFLYPGKINRQMSLITEKIDWVIGISDVVKNGEVVNTFRHEHEPWKGLAMCRGLGDTNANLFRRSALLEVNGYDELVVGEDYHLYFKLLKTEVSFVRDLTAGSAYVQHPGDRGVGRGKVARYKFRLGFLLKVETYLAENKKTFYEMELPFFNAAKVAALRMYMTGNYKEGKVRYDATFAGGLPWRKLDYNDLPTYWPLYAIFGFSRTERARIWWKGHTAV